MASSPFEAPNVSRETLPVTPFHVIVPSTITPHATTTVAVCTRAPSTTPDLGAKAVRHGSGSRTHAARPCAQQHPSEAVTVVCQPPRGHSGRNRGARKGSPPTDGEHPVMSPRAHPSSPTGARVSRETSIKGDAGELPHHSAPGRAGASLAKRLHRDPPPPA